MTSLCSSSFVRSFLLAFALLAVPAASSAEVFLSVGFAPPALPVYEQPLIPGPGYIWTPGYWAYGPEGFFWVPGTWVLAPYIGALWTPGYWGWDGGYYRWNRGYWGPRVGYYGGINYGFGYFGVGYHGGYWRDRAFVYNTAMNHVNTTYIHNTYNQPFAGHSNVSRVSFNGGAGGIVATPTTEERLAASDGHQSWTQAQMRHERAASIDRAQFASVNHGVPSLTATSRPGAFKEPNAAAVRGGGGGNKEMRIERGVPQGQNAINAGPPRGNKEARIEHSAPQGQNPANYGTPRAIKEGRIASGAPQGQSSTSTYNGPPRSNKEARMASGGPSPNVGGGHPQTMARPPQTMAPPQGQPHAQGQPHPQGQERGGRGAEQHEEKHK